MIIASMSATGEAMDLGQVLLDLLVVVVAARVAAELAERIRVPAVLGEIVVGIAIGPSVLGWIDIGRPDTAAMLLLLGEIGVLLLLLQVGMEMDLKELARVGPAALAVGLLGVALPFVGGALGAWTMGEAGTTAIFLGAALTATSVGITARVLGDLKALSRTESRVVLGAAVADDVLGLVILTVVVKLATDGSVSAGTVGSTIGIAVAFLVVTGAIGIVAVPKALDLIARSSRLPGALLVATFALVLAFAELADAAKLAFIIGAFMAGLAVGRSDHVHRIDDGVTSIARVFIPVFFVSIGVNADLDSMLRPSVLGLAAVLTAIGIVGKLAAGAAAIGTRADRLLIGIGMVPRGEVGVIFASIGLSRGIIDDDLYGSLLIVVLVTTVMAPPLLRWRLNTNAGDSSPEASTDGPRSDASRAIDDLLAGDDTAWDRLAVAPDLASTHPDVASVVRQFMIEAPGGQRRPSFMRVGAVGPSASLAVRRAAFVLDIADAAAMDAVDIERLAASVAPGDPDVATIARSTRLVLDITAHTDGVSQREVDALHRETPRADLLSAAHDLALLTPDLEAAQRSAIVILVAAVSALLG